MNLEAAKIIICKWIKKMNPRWLKMQKIWILRWWSRAYGATVVEDMNVISLFYMQTSETLSIVFSEKLKRATFLVASHRFNRFRFRNFENFSNGLPSDTRQSENDFFYFNWNQKYFQSQICSLLILLHVRNSTTIKAKFLENMKRYI